jgi:cyclophilin family peptidyl-prolyl cis-trans isomerase
MKTLFTSLIIALLAAPAAWADDAVVNEYPRYRFDTSEGSFVVELDGRKAPLTVANFAKLVEAKFYNGTIFHRVINAFVAQAGGYNEKLEEKEFGSDPIPNEAGNGLSNERGSIGMARTSKPHSATTQIYFNLADNRDLDPQPTRWGYAVFGKVTEGMEVLDRIAQIPTGPSPDGQLKSDFPHRPIIIEAVVPVD